MPTIREETLKLHASTDIFQPCSRTRSEASFSEFHYDHSNNRAAGVTSERLWSLKTPKAKDVSKDKALRVSSVQEIIRMTPEQEYNAHFERLDGPRLDPAKMRGHAGDMSAHTKAKVTLLGNHDSNATAVPTTDKHGKGAKSRGFILNNAQKAKAACSPPLRSTDPLRPTEEKFSRQLKRSGYPIAQSTWTWNECHEVTGQDPDFIEAHKSENVLAGLSSVEKKVYTSVKGEKKYAVCGSQDLLPARTKPFAQSDNPPSARHILENDRKHLSGFERGVRPRGLPPKDMQVEYLGESPEMWNCIAGYERPVDKWRTMSARTGQANWKDKSRDYYDNDDTMDLRSPGGTRTQTLYSRSESNIRSPDGGSSRWEEESKDSRRPETARGDRRRSDRENRRSVLSTPSNGSRTAREYRGERGDRGSVASSTRWR